MSGGRPSTYSDELAERIFERIAGDESLVSICKDEDMPSLTTVYRWKAENDLFRANYARAREDQGHTVADTVGDIRKRLLKGEIDPATATAAGNLAKWEASRRAGKDFGDRMDLNHTGELVLPPEMRQAEIERLIALRRANAPSTGG